MAVNGAAAIHDFDIALICETSEDVAAGLKHGTFGMVRETGERINRAVNRVLEERRTFWLDPEEMELDSLGSLTGVEIVVASPILDPQGAIIGAIYGDCRQETPSAAAPKVTKAQAIMVELLARSVAVGLARMEQERAAIAASVQFEQFFTRELSQQLAREPNLYSRGGYLVRVLRDRQPGGVLKRQEGSPRIAQVIAADLDRLGQLRPGEPVAFEEVTLAEAERLREEARGLQAECDARSAEARASAIQLGTTASSPNGSVRNVARPITVTS